MKENYVVLTLTGFRKQVFQRLNAFLLAPNEMTEALNNNKAFFFFFLTRMLHIADEFIKSLELLVSELFCKTVFRLQAGDGMSN